MQRLNYQETLIREKSFAKKETLYAQSLMLASFLLQTDAVDFKGAQ
jgi:hypothetical protein